MSLHQQFYKRKLWRSSDVIKLTNITYRQLDYWTRTGLFTPATDKNLKGSGNKRLFNYEDIVTVSIIKTLLDFGVDLMTIRKLFDNFDKTRKIGKRSYLIMRGESLKFVSNFGFALWRDQQNDDTSPMIAVMDIGALENNLATNMKEIIGG